MAAALMRMERRASADNAGILVVRRRSPAAATIGGQFNLGKMDKALSGGHEADRTWPDRGDSDAIATVALG